jgi:hypothetical protein
MHADDVTERCWNSCNLGEENRRMADCLLACVDPLAEDYEAAERECPDAWRDFHGLAGCHYLVRYFTEKLRAGYARASTAHMFEPGGDNYEPELDMGLYRGGRWV